MTIEELQENLVRLTGRKEDILARVAAEKRDLTQEEDNDMSSILDDFDHTTKRITQLQRHAEQNEALNAGQGRRTEPDPPAHLDGDGEGNVEVARPKRLATPTNGRVPQPRLNIGYERTGGFKSLGEMAYHVRMAAMPGSAMDPRLQRILAAPTIYGNEGSGSDGGFAVPPDFRTAIMETVMGEEALISRCDQIPLSGNSFTQPVDETTPWQTSGGIQAYWTGEAAVKTQSKPLLGERTVKLNKIAALVPMTDELLEDATAMDAYLRRKAPEKIRFAVDLAIIQGNGVGKPLGILNSPALVSVAKEGSQIADTLVASNVIKMYSRMYAPSRSRAVWVVNQDIEPMLLTMSLPGKDNTGSSVTGWGVPVYMPANGFSGSPFATLFGRPVIPSQATETLGDKGDIFFVDFTQYLAVLKSGVNPKTDISMHFWFDQDVTAYRFVLRVGGTPWWSAATSARDGSTTYSPYVTLDERA